VVAIPSNVPFGEGYNTSPSGEEKVCHAGAGRQAGIHLRLYCTAKEILDSGLRRNDERRASSRRIQTPSFSSRGAFGFSKFSEPQR
jgi:hypothetical protein